jgi:hypothetical protein
LLAREEPRRYTPKGILGDTLGRALSNDIPRRDFGAWPNSEQAERRSIVPGWDEVNL